MAPEADLWSPYVRTHTHTYARARPLASAAALRLIKASRLAHKCAPSYGHLCLCSFSKYCQLPPLCQAARRRHVKILAPTLHPLFISRFLGRMALLPTPTLPSQLPHWALSPRVPSSSRCLIAVLQKAPTQSPSPRPQALL